MKKKKQQPRKWAQTVDVKEGALKEIGWPSAKAIITSVRSGKVSRKTATARLNYLANVSKDPKTAKRARAIIVRMQQVFKKQDK